MRFKTQVICMYTHPFWREERECITTSLVIRRLQTNRKVNITQKCGFTTSLQRGCFQQNRNPLELPIEREGYYHRSGSQAGSNPSRARKQRGNNRVSLRRSHHLYFFNDWRLHTLYDWTQQKFTYDIKAESLFAHFNGTHSN